MWVFIIIPAISSLCGFFWSHLCAFCLFSYFLNPEWWDVGKISILSAMPWVQSLEGGFSLCLKHTIEQEWGWLFFVYPCSSQPQLLLFLLDFQSQWNSNPNLAGSLLGCHTVEWANTSLFNLWLGTMKAKWCLLLWLESCWTLVHLKYESKRCCLYLFLLKDACPCVFLLPLPNSAAVSCRQ